MCGKVSNRLFSPARRFSNSDRNNCGRGAKIAAVTPAE